MIGAHGVRAYTTARRRQCISLGMQDTSSMIIYQDTTITINRLLSAPRKVFNHSAEPSAQKNAHEEVYEGEPGFRRSEP